MADIADNILEAINLMIDKKLENLKFDKTAVCTILDDSEAYRGKYYVTDGYSKFYVYSESSLYTRGSVVNINIPNGDYSQTKYIIGKRITVSNDEVTQLGDDFQNRILNTPIEIDGVSKTLKEWIKSIQNGD